MNNAPAGVSKVLGVVVEPIPPTTDFLALADNDPARYPALFQSTARGTPRSRFNILFAFPQEAFGLAPGAGSAVSNELPTADFLGRLDIRWRASAPQICTQETHNLPFAGGWLLYLGYELAGQIEPRLEPLMRDPLLPVAEAVRIPAALIRDNLYERAWMVCEDQFANDLLPLLRADLRDIQMNEHRLPLAAWSAKEDEPERFLAGVHRVQEYIRAGDVYQVNLSRRWQAQLRSAESSTKLFDRLAEANPAPFAALRQWSRDRAIISSSPERLVEVRGRHISTRPIAGTFPRSTNATEDTRLSAALRRHPKERAEHIMLIDLERNDLGRICRPGSVQVAELMALESYRHVHHLVSEIVGTLREEVTPGDVIRAVFPGGTITGCPKLRCMEIIRELEDAPRGAYTGALGYLNHNGDLDLNILIRTLVQDGANVTLRAGAGIVADSVPARELEETRAKARGMLAALGLV